METKESIAKEFLKNNKGRLFNEVDCIEALIEVMTKWENAVLPQANVMRPLCPTCGKDTLITLSGITYCMVDCCAGVKGHNVA